MYMYIYIMYTCIYSHHNVTYTCILYTCTYTCIFTCIVATMLHVFCISNMYISMWLQFFEFDSYL